MHKITFGGTWMRMIGIAAVAGIAATALCWPTSATGKPAAAWPAKPLRLILPAPAGPDSAGIVSLHLIDPARRDPWIPSHPVRELMISITYPASDAGRYPAAPWLPAVAAAHFLAGMHVPPGQVKLPATHSHQGAPVDRRAGRLPVVLFSPGSKMDRSSDTVLAEDLASHGYAVVTIDHPHDSGEVEFPGGHLAVSTLPPDSTTVNTKATAVREADVRFVLNELTRLNAGHNPDAGHHPLPRGLAGDLNLAQVGMFGFSIGGAATANAMHDDPRIAAGIDLDGTVWGPVAATGLDRPFMFLSSQDNGRTVDPTWRQLWQHLRGWHLDLRLAGAEHLAFSDAAVLYPQAAPALGLTPRQLDQLTGTINGNRAVAVESAYIRAFFDRWLRHHDSRLLDKPSPRYPEIQFIR
ncbi:MAG TPA: lipase [Streptosporangiaceae bacterium]